MRERVWTAAEIEYLSLNYPSGGGREVATTLKRSADAITSMARRMGLRSPGRQPKHHPPKPRR